jgi:predicted DCC family thiol-disulfide oxidoreductase YuxK
MSTLIIYYDGLCHLCSREIEYYRKRAGENVTFVDIAAPDFDATTHGLDPNRVQQVMHVRQDGQLRLGLDAFIAIWETIPGHTWAARLAKTPGIHFLLGIGYQLFAWIRPYLPRKKADCPDGACQRRG